MSTRKIYIDSRQAQGTGSDFQLTLKQSVQVPEYTVAYIDDVVEIMMRLLDKPAMANPNFSTDDPEAHSSWAPHKIFNIGNSKPVHLMDFIKSLEKEIGIEANKVFLDMQPGDVKFTAADTSLIENYVDFKPNTSISKGIKKFYEWYKAYY